jgi:hypothetical protein
LGPHPFDSLTGALSGADPAQTRSDGYPGSQGGELLVLSLGRTD